MWPDAVPPNGGQGNGLHNDPFVRRKAGSYAVLPLVPACSNLLACLFDFTTAGYENVHIGQAVVGFGAAPSWALRESLKSPLTVHF
jgi:hypothetical protein